MLAVGQHFDRYVIEAVLGRGGMGVVYRAYDPRLERSVALKVLAPRDAGGPPGSPTDAREHERLLREARAAAAFDHPNAVAVHDVGEHDGVPYLAMELVEGRDLRACMGDASVTREQKMRWLIDAARALHAAHQRGLIHRDVKPENVMVRPDGVVKVLDFGIARRLSTDTQREPGRLPDFSTLTSEGSIVGTPQYMSPEQLRGEPLDGRSDQFAWAAMAYEVLGGSPAWSAAEHTPLVAAVLTKEPAPLLGVPTGVARVVSRALAKEASARFASMGDVASALEAAGSSATDEALAPTQALMRQDVTGRRRRPRAVVLGALALAAGVAVGAWVFARTRAAPSPSLSSASSLSSSSSSSEADALAAPVAHACNEVPHVDTTSVEALTALRTAVQAGCDDSPRTAREAFERAVAADPSMAVAHLGLAWSAFSYGDVPAARTEMLRARELRGSLSERDAELLSIEEPLVLGAPADWGEALARCDAAIERRPLDSRLYSFRGYLRMQREDYEGARSDLRRSSALDPHNASALDNLGQTYDDEGRQDEALAAYGRCLAVSRTAINCLGQHILVEIARGDCAAMAADVDGVLAANATYESGYRYRGDVLASHGASNETLAAAFEQAEERARPEMRDDHHWLYRCDLALWAGDLVAGEAAARSRIAALSADTTLSSHGAAAWRLAQILLEEGRTREAGEAAGDFLARRDLWTASTLNSPLGQDPTPQLVETARLAGRLTTKQRDEQRDDWLARWSAALARPTKLRSLQIAAYVLAVETPDDAVDAVARLPPLLPLPSTWYDTGAFILGKAYFLAGHTADAIPHLRRAAGSCVALEHPVETMRASLMLGRALAATGDTGGACAAYRAVLDRWGKTKGRSVTAEDARASAAKLGCH
jgi:serine/threonine protein kinase/tetratricopeptide (TPR) repeat protein